jgi:hypothetical protein
MSNDFASEFTKEAKDRGGFKTLAGAVGMPDKDDWETIVKLINIFRKDSVKRYGKDILVECISNAKKEHIASAHDSGFMLVNKDSSMRHIFELPESFIHVIEKSYPLMFQDKKHFAWFSRNFKELRLPEKY